MRSATAKVLHELGGRSMLGHVVQAARALDPEHLIVVVGHAREQVTAHLKELDAQATAVVQAEQNGTGHAVRIALDGLDHLEGTVVVLPGDAPLVTPASLKELVEQHEAAAAATTMLTARYPDPTGYGRVVRSGAEVIRVVEHKDADPDVLRINEIATGHYAFAAGPLREALSKLSTDNAQGEEYLPDVVRIHKEAGLTVGGRIADNWAETVGVNDRIQLAVAARMLRDRINRHHMLAGVAILDPETTWIDADVALEADATVLPQTQLKGTTVVRRGAVVGPDSTLTDTVVGAGAVVRRTTADGAVIGAEATVGPYSYLRPGTKLGRGAKVGAYVETKNAEIGEDSKVPHLSYVGDATIGQGSNVGAATVFVNYDGVAKHHTTVGDHVRIGSDTMLVAPVTVGDGAYTAAGSVIISDVPPGAMGVARAQQRNVGGWVRRRRAGSAAAEAAAAAEARAEESDAGPSGAST